MSAPTVFGMLALKHLARYLIGARRVDSKYIYQEEYEDISIWTDSDWAGDRIERKSTSGGVVMLGNHCIKTWSSIQKTVALSSAEAEYVAMVKGGSIGLGIRSMLSDFEIRRPLVSRSV